MYKDQIQRLFEITQGESAPEYINCMTRYHYCKVNLLDQSESGLHYLRGTFDTLRLQRDPELYNLTIGTLRLTNLSLPYFIEKLKQTLISIYTNGIDN
jgi:hypothetical protein